MHTPIPVVLTALALGTLSACGGGSSSSNVPDDPITVPVAADSPCDTEYHRRLIGTYVGAIDYDASAESDEGGSVCRHDLQIEIRPRDIDTGRCELEARATSSVEQSVVLPATSPVASECAAADDTLVLIDPLAAIENPELGADYTLPVRLEYENRAPLESDRGPYFGDASVSARYVRLFGGTAPEIAVFVIDDDALMLEQRDPTPERVIGGELMRQ